MFVLAKMSWRTLLVSIVLIVLVACGGNDNNDQDVEVVANNTEQKNEGEDTEEKAASGDGDIVNRKGVIASPSLENIIDTFQKLEFTMDTEVMDENGELDNEINQKITYEYLGEEEVDGETVDHIKIKLEAMGDSEGEYWINQDGISVKMIRDGNEEEDPTAFDNIFLTTLLEPFRQFENDLASHVSQGNFKITDHSTSEVDVLGEVYESLQVDAENDGSNIGEQYSKAEVYYYDEFQIISSIEIMEDFVRDRKIEMLEIEHR